MRKIVSTFLLVMSITLLITSCRKDEVNEYQVLTDYLKANTRDLTDVTNGWVKGISTLGAVTTDGDDADTNPDYTLPSYYIMDLRNATDFAAGHINGAVNVALKDIITQAPNAGTKPILCVCYTGQTAARATGFLRLAGYTAYCMKWGMSAWHGDFAAKWDNNAKQLGNQNWVKYDDPTAPGLYNVPVLNTGKSTGEEILKARIQQVLEKSWSVSNADVLANPGNYYISNRWDAATWNSYGHIKGAHRLEPLNIDMLKYFNPEYGTIVTYCYTGQTSSITTAWLQVLGYENARSLSFGANGIIYTDMKNNLLLPSVQGSTWKGANSGSANNYGYYKSDGTYVAPI